MKLLYLQPALINFKINNEKFKTIVNEKEKYEKIEEDIRMMKKRDELNKKGNKIKQHNYEWK